MTDDEPPLRSHGPRRPWTSEEDEELRTRLTDRQQLAAIARSMGRTLEAVRARAQALRLVSGSSLRPWRSFPRRS